MPGSFFTFFLPITFFLLSYTPLHISSTITPNARRILHQPFLPQDSFPPSQPPSHSPPSPPAPTPPKIPFSSPTPDQSPFFPSYSSSPPPPSPVAFASFPANISSLILPQSSKPKPTSQKLLAVAISAVISALVVLGLLIFYYARRRRSSPGFTDDKAYRSDNSNRQYQVNADTRTGSNGHKLRTTSTSSEFLYLGTLVNSTRLEEGPNGNSDVGSDRRKLESPELRPLPPLNRENSRQSYGNREVEYSTNGDDDNEEGEEEEFYSPRGSLGGRESSSGTGSGSRRMLTTAAAAAASVGFDSKSINSSCSCSSSSSASPARSQSLSISPPVSLSPRPKSHQSSTVLAANSPQLTPPTVDAHDERETSSDSSADASPRITLNLERNVLSSGSTSPNRHLEKSAGQSPVRSPSLSPARVLNNLAQNRLASSPSSVSTSPDRALFSDLARFNVHSPTLSSFSASPERLLEKIPSSKASNDLDRAAQCPSLYVASSSPERHLDESARSSPRISNVSDQNKMSPALSVASTSPERDLEKSALSSPRISNVSDRNKMSSLLSVASSSPERDLEKSALSSPRISNVSDRNKMSPSLLSSTSSSPKRGLDKSPVSSPRISNASDGKNMSSTLLSSASSSPGRSIEKISLSSPRMSNFSDRNKMSPTLLSSASPSPGRGFDKSPGAAPRMNSGLNERISCVLEQHVSVPPPPPPPPLPPPMLIPQRQWDSPVASTPTDQPISKPPALIPPSRPFVLQSTSNISPIELPKSHKPVEAVEETPKPKLKPLHWDKVRASSDREMVWDQLRSSSFKLNEEMIETLFVVNTPKPKQATPHSVSPTANQENRVLDPKKAQNIAILLRALNVTIEEVCEGLLEGNVDTLGTELLESLLKMAPSKEEERKLKEYKDDSPFKLGHAEKFLKAVLDVPFAFKRVDAMLYIANFESEIEYLKKSFETLEAACEELRNSRMFLKLLEAVLKTGNRMNVGTNRGDARAFKLDTLLKLVDVKGADGKTTLLHFVVQEIIRTEGARLSGSNQNPNSTSSDDAKCRRLGLQVVSSLSSELNNVKKAAAMDSDVLSSDVVKLSRGIENISEVVRLNETLGMVESYQKFSESMNRFMKMAEEEIIRTQAQESVALSLVKEITEYFHGNSAMEEAHPFRIFMVVRDFLSVLDRVCKEVGMINERTIVSSAHRFPVPVNPMLPIPVNPTLPQVVFSGSNAGNKDDDSSDDESASSP